MATNPSDRGLEELLAQLPPEVRAEVADFAAFLLERRGAAGGRNLQLDKEEALQHLRVESASVEMQHAGIGPHAPVRMLRVKGEDRSGGTTREVALGWVVCPVCAHRATGCRPPLVALDVGPRGPHGLPTCAGIERAP